MPSSKEYLDYILELLSEVDDISVKGMMGEYILYVRGKVFGGIYDDRFLVKPTRGAKERMPEAKEEIPYEGAKPMLLVDSEDPAFLKDLIEQMAEELPTPKKSARR